MSASVNKSPAALSITSLIVSVASGALLSAVSSWCLAEDGASGSGARLGLGFWAHAGVSNVDYSDSSNSSRGKNSINDENPSYYAATVTIDPSYGLNGFQLKLHLQLQVEEPWLDDDRIDELAFELDNKRLGTAYLGEDDGAADRMRSPQAGRVGIAIGHGAYSGVIPWWGNLPYKGGVNREKLFDWSDGIVSGDWRSFDRDTGNAIKTGYLSPLLNGWAFGASINLQDTYAGYTPANPAPTRQDSWSHLGLKGDEYELAARWQGETDQGLKLEAGLTHVSAHIVNSEILQVNTDAGFKASRQLASGAMVGGSLYYAQQNYEADGRDDERAEQMHLGLEWIKRRWKIGVNYFLAREYWNPTYTVKLGGGGSRGYSVGVDYKVAKGLIFSGGVIKAENDAGEKATEVGLNATYKFETLM